MGDIFDIGLDIGYLDKIKGHIRRFLLFPEFWEDPQKMIYERLKWHYVKFKEENLDDIPTKNGIYCFIVSPDIEEDFIITRYLFYIGKAERKTLRSRYKDYLQEQKGLYKPRPKVEEMLKRYKNHIYFFYTTIENNKKISEYEEKLLNKYVPYVNTFIPEAKITRELQYIY